MTSSNETQPPLPGGEIAHLARRVDDARRAKSPFAARYDAAQSEAIAASDAVRQRRAERAELVASRASTDELSDFDLATEAVTLRAEAMAVIAMAAASDMREADRAIGLIDAELASNRRQLATLISMEPTIARRVLIFERELQLARSAVEQINASLLREREQIRLISDEIARLNGSGDTKTAACGETRKSAP